MEVGGGVGDGHVPIHQGGVGQVKTGRKQIMDEKMRENITYFI
jgi:hypothetical protein